MIRLRPALVIAALLLVTGCGSIVEPPAVPPPVIEDAKDVRRADPCALLPAGQADRLGVPTTAAAPITTPEGPGCEWRGDAGISLSVALYVDGGGLATLAANSEPTTTRVRIDGFPALETFTGRGEFCQYDVAVALDQVMLTSMTGGAPDSCTALQQVVVAMLAEAPRASG